MFHLAYQRCYTVRKDWSTKFTKFLHSKKVNSYYYYYYYYYYVIILKNKLKEKQDKQSFDFIPDSISLILEIISPKLKQFHESKFYYSFFYKLGDFGKIIYQINIIWRNGWFNISLVYSFTKPLNLIKKNPKYLLINVATTNTCWSLWHHSTLVGTFFYQKMKKILFKRCNLKTIFQLWVFFFFNQLYYNQCKKSLFHIGHSYNRSKHY